MAKCVGSDLFQYASGQQNARFNLKLDVWLESKKNCMGVCGCYLEANKNYFLIRSLKLN
jgi:hypothetical protein